MLCFVRGMLPAVSCRIHAWEDASESSSAKWSRQEYSTP